MYEPRVTVDSEADLKSILGRDFPSQTGKVLDHVDALCRTWIERCPFVVISSCSASGLMDISPKGDPPGFVKVLDPHTLVVPDRLGNNRGDTFRNVLENPAVGLMFVMPRRREVVRVAGTARIVRDRELLEPMAMNGKVPDLALLVRVREAFFHCGKSVIRSALWEPERWPPIDGLPSYAEALKAHARLDAALPDIERGVTANEVDRLY